MNRRIRTALLSVTDRAGLLPFARGLRRYGVVIHATPGTRAVLRAAGVPVRSTEELTGFRDLFDGRVKTLHPAVLGGVLAVRSKAEHRSQLRAHGWPEIDLVAANPYRFPANGATRHAVLDALDIGGVTLIRAAAKNQTDVTVVCRPESYAPVLDEMRRTGGAVGEALRKELAAEAFSVIAAYEMETLRRVAATPLRYGENPHQRAALCPLPESRGTWRLLQGKPLSYNNLLDADAALKLAAELQRAACAIIKHQTPCGAALGRSVVEAFTRAFTADSVSAFGGVVALNRDCDGAVARAMEGKFLEVVCAPSFRPEALRGFRRRPNLRVIQAALSPGPAMEMRVTRFGLLFQEADAGGAETWRVATHRKPTPDEMRDLRFAWTVCKHVRSNAIVLASNGVTVGIGAGQTSRVDAVRVAGMRVASPPHPFSLASDGFFPFADGVEEAARLGVTAVVQPGGSIRDGEVIAAADRNRMVMALTGERHFRH